MKVPNATVAVVSMVDIEKALQGKLAIDPHMKLLKEYWEWLQVFDRKEADELLLYRLGIDYRVKLEGKGSEAPQIPLGPLYRMLREMLLVLCKMLMELLDKGFI